MAPALQAGQPEGARRQGQGPGRATSSPRSSTSRRSTATAGDIRIHGVNLSVGYDFEPSGSPAARARCASRWTAWCARAWWSWSRPATPATAGNQTARRGARRGRAWTLTINDPGNAELAITVGSTHRDMPHVYGVSYFSSKGPTGDGRLKPDLVAPGEKIISCAARRSCADGAASARRRRTRDAPTTSRTAARAWRRRTSRA